MRLIDTEKAWKTAQRIYSDPVLLHAIKNVLDSTTTVDAVEVVRCNECQYADYSGCASGMVCCLEHGCYMEESEFCSCGGREATDK